MAAVVAFSFFLVAVVYAAVGQGGGSGYLAVMGLLGLPVSMMKPTALSLNILVAGIGTWKFYKAGHFSGKLFWPVAVTSVPFAFLGGRTLLPDSVYTPVVGLLLLVAAFRLLTAGTRVRAGNVWIRSPWPPILAGAGIGYLSGTLGIGGGILLSPVLILSGWADIRETLGVTAAFVLVNSIAGLAGHLSMIAALPPEMALWLVVAGFGGWVGAEHGSRRLKSVHLRRLLAGVLAVGGLRMLFS